MIDVSNIIKVYEIAGMETDGDDVIGIASYSNDNKKIRIDVDDKSYVVVARDLVAAIENATNANGY